MVEVEDDKVTGRGTRGTWEGKPGVDYKFGHRAACVLQGWKPSLWGGLCFSTAVTLSAPVFREMTSWLPVPGLVCSDDTTFPWSVRWLFGKRIKKICAHLFSFIFRLDFFFLKRVSEKDTGKPRVL